MSALQLVGLTFIGPLLIQLLLVLGLLLVIQLLVVQRLAARHQAFPRRTSVYFVGLLVNGQVCSADSFAARRRAIAHLAAASSSCAALYIVMQLFVKMLIVGIIS